MFTFKFSKFHRNGTITSTNTVGGIEDSIPLSLFSKSHKPKSIKFTSIKNLTLTAFHLISRSSYEIPKCEKFFVINYTNNELNLYGAESSQLLRYNRGLLKDCRNLVAKSGVNMSDRDFFNSSTELLMIPMFRRFSYGVEVIKNEALNHILIKKVMSLL